MWRAGLVALALGTTGVRAELNAEKWTPAVGAGQKSAMGAGMSGLFYVMNPERGIIATAGESEIPADRRPDARGLAAFYDDILHDAGAAGKTTVTLSGHEAVEYEVKMNGEHQMVLLCVVGDKLVTLTVLCEKPLGWDDKDVQELVEELPLGKK